jgi:DNA anti-recombination protein RmuC
MNQTEILLTIIGFLVSTLLTILAWVGNGMNGNMKNINKTLGNIEKELGILSNDHGNLKEEVRNIKERLTKAEI